MKTVVKSYIDEFVALVKGDDATVIAERTKRQAKAALDAQIPNLKGDLVGKEDDVAAAKTALKKAILNNGQEIEANSSGRKKYADGILEATNNLTKAEEELEKHKKRIQVLEGAQAKLEGGFESAE